MGLWSRSLLAVYDLDDLAALDVPWWTFEASDRVNAFLESRGGARVFEWGSGSSTLWLSKRAGHVVSVEHDGGWAEQVSALVPSTVDLRFVPAVPWDGCGSRVSSSRRGFEDRDFSSYVAEVEAVGGKFDLIVVDGRAREACLDRAVGHLTYGGILVVDNVERERYRRAIAGLGSRVEVEWTKGLTPCLPYPTQTALIRSTQS